MELDPTKRYSLEETIELLIRSPQSTETPAAVVAKDVLEERGEILMSGQKSDSEETAK